MTDDLPFSSTRKMTPEQYEAFKAYCRENNGPSHPWLLPSDEWLDQEVRKRTSPKNGAELLSSKMTEAFRTDNALLQEIGKRKGSR